MDFFLGLLIVAAGVFTYKKVKAKKLNKNHLQRSSLKPSNTQSKNTVRSASDNMEVIKVHVAGVTYKNGRRTRQAILRAIKWNDVPYDGIDKVAVKKTTFEDSDAFEVWANDEMIGYVPKTQVQFFSQNWGRYCRSGGLNVHGGGSAPDGERLNYGATFNAAFYLDIPGAMSV